MRKVIKGHEVSKRGMKDVLVTSRLEEEVMEDVLVTTWFEQNILSLSVDQRYVHIK
jgi:hypothetical protein